MFGWLNTVDVLYEALKRSCDTMFIVLHDTY